jgi:DNA ligase 1
VRRHEADEIPITVGFLSGVPRPGRIGVGDSTVYARRPCAGAEPALTVGDLDRAITAVSEATGAGCAPRGEHILGDLFCRATDEEAGFVKWR